MEEDFDICYNMNEHQGHCAKGNSQSQQVKQCVVYTYKIHLTESESRMSAS